MYWNSHFGYQLCQCIPLKLYESPCENQVDGLPLPAPLGWGMYVAYVWLVSNVLEFTFRWRVVWTSNIFRTFDNSKFHAMSVMQRSHTHVLHVKTQISAQIMLNYLECLVPLFSNWISEIPPELCFTSSLKDPYICHSFWQFPLHAMSLATISTLVARQILKSSRMVMGGHETLGNAYVQKLGWIFYIVFAVSHMYLGTTPESLSPLPPLPPPLSLPLPLPAYSLHLFFCS